MQVYLPTCSLPTVAVICSYKQLGMGVYASEQVTSAALGLVPPLWHPSRKQNYIGFLGNLFATVRKNQSVFSLLHTIRIHCIVREVLPGMSCFCALRTHFDGQP